VLCHMQLTFCSGLTSFRESYASVLMLYLCPADWCLFFSFKHGDSIVCFMLFVCFSGLALELNGP
jgi:hypothetical protein